MARGARLDLAFQPVVDGTVLPDLPLHTIASGATGNVPLMIGTTLDEMTLFLALDLGVGEIDGEALNRQMQRFFGERTAEVVGRYTENRGDAVSGRAHRDLDRPRVPHPGDPSRRGRRHVGSGRRSCTCSRGRARSWAASSKELPRARAAVHVGRARRARALATHRRRPGAPGDRRCHARGLDRVRPHRRSRAGRPTTLDRRATEALRHDHRDPRRPDGRRAALWTGVGLLGRPASSRPAERAQGPLRVPSWARRTVLLDDGAAVDGERVADDKLAASEQSQTIAHDLLRPGPTSASAPRCASSSRSSRRRP